MTVEELKNKFPGCWSILFRDAKYFFYHKYKVQGDKEFIKSLFESGNEEMLDYMEHFYALLRQDQVCNKDISSRSLPVNQRNPKWK